MKALLPRRESERRNHKLSCHCDILTAIETRISLLSMTFVKYIDLDICCFIPGKVIDEIHVAKADHQSRLESWLHQREIERSGYPAPDLPYSRASLTEFMTVAYLSAMCMLKIFTIKNM